MPADHSDPRENLVRAMGRLYRDGLTTSSGGNLSLKDEQGNIWITPAGFDKGMIGPEDIVRVGPDGTRSGKHRPSSELPFHKAIYERRPDIGGIVHAHAPALVAFSLVREAPELRAFPLAYARCGPMGYVSYHMPGSKALGDALSEAFGQGHNAVLMENHGPVVSGRDFKEAFARFEVLEFTCRALIHSKRIGRARIPGPPLPEGGEELSGNGPFRSTEKGAPSAHEQSLRKGMTGYVRRACEQGLMLSSAGACALRLDDDAFLVTPENLDRGILEPSDMVKIASGQQAGPGSPSLFSPVMAKIFSENPDIRSVFVSYAPYLSAFSITGVKLDTRSIPESYVLLREIQSLPAGSHAGDGVALRRCLASGAYLTLIDNGPIVSTGRSLAEAFDRLEVAEFSARALVESAALGKMIPISGEALKDLREKYLG